MNQFEYLSVLLSIIVGLGISHLLSSAARLIQLRRRTRLHAPTLIWMALLLIVQIQVWWVGFERTDQTRWQFFLFLLYLCIPIGLFLLSYLIVPDLDELDQIDLRASFHENRHWLYGLLIAVVLCSLTNEAIENGAFPTDLDAQLRAAYIGLSCTGLALRRDRAHTILSAALLAIFAGYVVLLFQNLRM